MREVAELLLVTTGGSDAEGLGSRVAVGLADALPADRRSVRSSVRGAWAPTTTASRSSTRPTVSVPRLAAADVVVTAGGVTMLEACCLGRPVVAFSIAPGQGRALAGAAHVGAVVAVDVGSAADVAARLARDVDARSRLSTSARVLVDGQGSARVAAVIAGMARHGVHAR